jgi:hypothetical protein
MRLRIAGARTYQLEYPRHWRWRPDPTSSMDTTTASSQATKLAPDAVSRPHSAELSFPSEHLLPHQQEDDLEAEDSGYDSLPESPLSSLVDAPPSPSSTSLPVPTNRTFDLSSPLDGAEYPTIRKTNSFQPRVTLRDKGLGHRSIDPVNEDDSADRVVQKRFTPVDGDDPVVHSYSSRATQRRTGPSEKEQMVVRFKQLKEAKKQRRLEHAEAKRKAVSETDSPA